MHPLLLFVDDINLHLRTVNYGNYGMFLSMGNAGYIYHQPFVRIDLGSISI